MNKNNKHQIFWRQWLEKYKSLNYIWDSSLETTSNERLRAWNELIEMTKTVDSEANVFKVHARLKKFIYKYKLEAKKVKVARANGLSYKPKTYYYKIFKNIYETNEKKSNALEPNNQFERKAAYQKNWRNVLTLYAYYKCLWDKRAYTTKERFSGWQKITKLARICFPNTSVNAVKARIRNSRTIYLNEKKRIDAARKSGLVYNTKLFYFDILDQLEQNGKFTINENSDDSIQTNEDSPNDNLLSEAGEKRWRGDKKIWRKILKRYVSFKCLWDSEHAKQYTKVERNAAWLELLGMLQKCDPKADLAFLKSRISNSRSVGKREIDKTNSEMQQGRTYKSKLFYYDIIYGLYQNQEGIVEFSTDESSDENESMLISPNKEATSTQILEAELKQKNLIFAPLNDNPKYFERKIWLEVIKKYIYCECLWNTENRDYYNADERSHAWQKLTEIAKKIDKTVDVDFVKKRIKHYRTAYMRQLKSAQEAKKKGKFYEIKLFYFNALSPIYQKNFPILNYDNIEIELDENALECKSALNPKSNTYFPEDDEEIIAENVQSNKCSNLEYTITKEEEETLDFHIETLESFEENVEYKPNTNNFDCLDNMETLLTSDETVRIRKKRHAKHTSVDSAFATFEEKIAQHLESMEDCQYLLAEKFISDVCISGRHRELTRKSCILLKKS